MADPLDSPPPPVTGPEAEALMREIWGITARAAPIACERDSNFRLDSGHVLKLSNPAEPPQDTHFQTGALLWLAAQDPGLPVPRMVPARDGRHAVPVPLRDGRVSLARVLSWVEGVPLARVPRTPGMAAEIGDVLARMGRALAGYRHPAAARHLQWDIRHTPGLRPMLVPEQQDMAAEIDHFESCVAPVLSRLRAQVVHNDMNHHNILVHPQDPARIAGVLDFGDMVQTALVCDVAVAAAYLVGQDADPLDPVVRMVAAYHAVTPLEPAEIDLLRDLIVARMVTSVVISEHRARRYPDNAAYILRNTPGVRAALARVVGLPRDSLRDRLRAALR